MYRVKVTWTDRDGNAVCLGFDGVLEVEADSEANAIHQALCESMDFHDQNNDCQKKGYAPVGEIIEDGHAS